MTLPPRDFHEFADEGPVTWHDFSKWTQHEDVMRFAVSHFTDRFSVSSDEICHVKEITKYANAVGIIKTYGVNTLQAMNAFQSHVLGNKCSEEDADIIL